MAAILFRADASPEMGGGHLMRCLALAEALLEAGHDCHFACAQTLPAIERRLTALGVSVHSIDRTSDRDSTATSAAARAIDAAAIVVDGYQFDAGWRKALRSAGRPILAFSDATPPLPLHADLAVDAAADPADAINRAPETKWLLGPRYMLLRRDLASAARLPPLPMEARDRVLVIFGSTDPLGLTLPVARLLASHLGVRVPLDVVVGGGVADGEAVARAVRDIGAGVTVHYDPPVMGILMRRAGLAVTAGGGTLGELAALGVPSVTAIVADNQVHDRRTIPAVDWWDPVDARLPDAAETLVARTEAAWRDLEGRARLAQDLRARIDAEGASRIAASLLRLCPPATARDG
jgi:UDP-2,4-diacetamido-2,4,6-trideoxy-beta-L-altropyranose hydrolase